MISTTPGGGWHAIIGDQSLPIVLWETTAEVNEGGSYSATVGLIQDGTGPWLMPVTDAEGFKRYLAPGITFVPAGQEPPPGHEPLDGREKAFSPRPGVMSWGRG